MCSWCISLAERFEPGDDGARKKNRDGGPDPRRRVCRASPGTSLLCEWRRGERRISRGRDRAAADVGLDTRRHDRCPHWLDRLQWGISESSSERIRPELQGLEVGDRVPDSRDWSVFFTVERLEPERLLVLRSTRHLLKPMRSIDFSWAFALESVGERGTRLIMRARARCDPRAAWLLLGGLIGLGDFLNASVMLRGIKRRSERTRTAGCDDARGANAS